MSNGTASTLPSNTTGDRTLRQRDIMPPERLASRHISIIGVGAIGRQVALQLAAMGAMHLQLFDHDVVEGVNLGPQGYFPVDLGHKKVAATKTLIAQVNPDTQVDAIPERFRRSAQNIGDVIFVCVDSIETRKLIWQAVGTHAAFFADGRMSAEVLRVLCVNDHASRRYYPQTLFAAQEAFMGACTSKSTLYCASIAAGIMLSQFAKYLRDLPLDPDIMLNLLAGELAIANPQGSPT